MFFEFHTIHNFGKGTFSAFRLGDFIKIEDHDEECALKACDLWGPISGIRLRDSSGFFLFLKKNRLPVDFTVHSKSNFNSLKCIQKQSLNLEEKNATSSVNCGYNFL